MTQLCSDVSEGTPSQTCKCLILQMQWPGKQGCHMHTHCCTRRTLGSYRTRRLESQTPVHSILSGRTLWQAGVGDNIPCWHRVVTDTKKIRIYFPAWAEISWRDLFLGEVWLPITQSRGTNQFPFGLFEAYALLRWDIWTKYREWLKNKDWKHYYLNVRHSGLPLLISSISPLHINHFHLLPPNPLLQISIRDKRTTHVADRRLTSSSPAISPHLWQ